MTKTILQKNTGDEEYRYRLIQFSDKYVIFRTANNNVDQMLTEADFGEKIAEFNNEEKAKEAFAKL